MSVISISEAKAKLSKYSRLAQKGIPTVVANHHKPIFVISPIEKKPAAGQVKFGLLKGHTCKMSEDFDAEDEALNRDWYEEA